MHFEEKVHKVEYKLNDTDDQIIEYIEKISRPLIHSIIGRSFVNVSLRMFKCL